MSKLVKMIGKALAVTALVAVPMLAVAVEVDKNLPNYVKADGVSGSVKSVGSDTLNNLMTLWAEEFKKQYPSVAIEIEGKGSSTAPPALIAGTAQLGPMSREMKSTEVDKFKEKFGYEPTKVEVALDALAVFVHKDNPIKELSLDQVRMIYSVEGKDMTWGDLGLTGDWADKKISLYGRNSASGTYGFFKEHALKNKDYKPTVKEQPGSSAVVQGVATDKYGVGYSGIGYVTADVRAVPLAAKDGAKVYEASAENAYAGDYPLQRFLFVYVNVKPGSGASPIVQEFIKLILSQEGQQTVVKDGYYPVPALVATKNVKAVSGK